MADVIHEFEFRAADSNGVEYDAVVMGEQRGNVWVGWLEFTPALGDRLRTSEETSQPDHRALVYWASGLEPIYLEGALRRAG